MTRAIYNESVTHTTKNYLACEKGVPSAGVTPCNLIYQVDGI